MKINEVSQSFKMSADTLRYYEKIGLIEKVEKQNGIRNYQERDIERIKFIQCLKKTGMPLDIMRQYFEFYNQGDGTLQARLDLLEEQRIIAQEEMEALQSSMEYLEYKIGLTKENIKKSSS